MNTGMKRVHTFEKASLVVEEKNDLIKDQRNVSKVRRPIEVSQTQTAHASRRIQPYESQPLLTTTSVFSFGAVIVLLAHLWVPLALLFVWTCARLQRYWFRENDVSSTRRRLLKDFLRRDPQVAQLRQIPKGMHVEEAFWENRRYVGSMASPL